MSDPHMVPNAGMPHMGGHFGNGIVGMQGDGYGGVYQQLQGNAVGMMAQQQAQAMAAMSQAGMQQAMGVMGPSMGQSHSGSPMVGSSGMVGALGGVVPGSSVDPLGQAAPRPKRMRSDTEVAYGGAFPECIKMVNGLLSNKQSSAFSRPVDPIALGIPDYPTIITRPMDLSTVKGNLQHGVYANAEEFADDVRLVWNNCEKYNGADHYITKQAEALRKIFEKQFSQLKTKEFEPLPEGYVPPSMKGKPPKKIQKLDGAQPRAEMSFDEKRALCTQINSLDPKYLGRVIQIINKCLPSILDDRSPGQEEIEISVETLSTTALRELEDYVKELKQQQVI